MIQTNLSATLATHQDQTLFEPNEDAYLIRKLTPQECARLQGFPEWWCANLKDTDLNFWRKTFDTYCELNGIKRKTDNQIKKFMEQPYSETAEYKMWGNGVALPCVWFILAGIEWYDKKKREENDEYYSRSDIAAW